MSDIQNTPLEDLTSQVAKAMTQWQSGENIKEEAAEIERATAQGPQADTTVLPSAAASKPAIRQVISPMRAIQTVMVAEAAYQPLTWNNSGDVVSATGQ